MRGLLLSCVLAAASPASAQSDAVIPPDNVELAAMFDADQAARKTDEIDWTALSKSDAQRRERVREMLDAGQLKTGKDYWHAAFIFQHGGRPDDYLLAHALAVRSLGLGYNRAEWIAAATLDRYLQSTDRSQIYGTQTVWTREDGLSKGAFDRDLLTDDLREGARVPSLAEQDETLEELMASSLPFGEE